MGGKGTLSQFKFRKNDSIGAAGAEEDLEFLQECFLDTGDLEVLRDLNDIRQLVVGRTGAGKSALLWQLKHLREGQVIEICPENLALAYVSHSTILRFFSELGVNLDPFFKLLWRHVLTVEVLEKYFQDHPDSKSPNVWERLKAKFSNESKKDKSAREALKYLESWGSKFWVETEYRVKEITRRVEEELASEATAKLGVDPAAIAGSLAGALRLTKEQREELLTRGQEIISKAQVQDLSKVIQLLDSVLEDRKHGYFILIDGLDEQWVEDRLRYRLIMALILTAKDFTRVRNAKAVISMRDDLLGRVFRLTRKSGFQQEKYEALYLRLTWTGQELLDLLDRRIEHLVRRRYTSSSVGHRDLLPRTYRKQPISDYLANRVSRPRDIIDLFNKCILAAPNLSKLSAKEFRSAEGEYSRSRLKALADEWSGDYPELLEFVRLLYGRSESFKIDQIDRSKTEEFCLARIVSGSTCGGFLDKAAERLIDCDLSFEDFRRIVVQVFYKVGLVGLKLTPHEKAAWPDERGRFLSSAEITETVSVVVHPMYHRALGIRSG